MIEVDVAWTRERLAELDVGEARHQFPLTYQLWRDGELPPFWIANAIDRVRGGAETLAAALDCPVWFVAGWGAGEWYPGWDAVCAVAVAAGVRVGDLELHAGQVPTTRSGAGAEDAVSAVLAVEFRPVVVAASVQLRGRRWGVPKTPEEATRSETARQLARAEVRAMLQHADRTPPSHEPTLR